MMNYQQYYGGMPANYGNYPAPPRTANQRRDAAQMPMPLTYDMTSGQRRPPMGQQPYQQQMPYGMQPGMAQQQTGGFGQMPYGMPRSPWLNNQTGTGDTSQMFPQQQMQYMPNHLRNWRQFRNFSGGNYSQQPHQQVATY